MWFSSILLAAVAVIVGVLLTRQPQTGVVLDLARPLVPIVSLIVLGLSVYAVQRTDALAVTVAGISMVSVASFVYAFSVGPLLAQSQKSDSVVLSLPIVAATMMGVGRRSLTACIVICGLGYTIPATAAMFGASLSGRTVVLDFTALGSFVAVSLLLAVLFTARRGATKGASVLSLASMQEESVVEEARLLGHASSLLHDTVLGDLHALAMLPPGPIPESHLAVIRRDLELLERSDELLRDSTTGALPTLIETTSSTPLARMLDRIGSRGLRVVVSGEPAELGELSPSTEDALVGAIEQCLVNVAVHAGVSLAELAIVSVGDELTATVADSGRGFTASATPGDRLGLRLSVHERMRRVGGSATVWSTPGAGTSVLLAVPKAHP
jgi:signal transduction histidine kinase